MNRNIGAIAPLCAVAALLQTSTAWAGEASSAAAPTGASTIAEAITGGKLILDLRPRLESVDQDNLAREAEAFTVRTQLGWQTGVWNGFQGQLAVANVSHIGAEHYNTTNNGKTKYPVIADPDTTELNRAQLSWTLPKTLTVTLGRQVILIDDQRFVGDVNWRQDEQTFDAARVDAARGPFSGTYIYLGHVNRVFAQAQDWNSDSHLLNLALSASPALKLEGFYYALDFTTPTAAARAASTQTTGVRVSGGFKPAPFQVGYSATYAHQTPYGANPGRFDLDYWQGGASGTLGLVTLKANYESLGGDGVRGFATPLATLHAFQGWADVFLTTPAKGIQDANVVASVKLPIAFEHFHDGELFVRYHDFETVTTGKPLGTELDLQATASLTPHLSTIAKVAAYHGVAGFPSRTKVWFGFEYKY